MSKFEGLHNNLHFGEVPPYLKHLTMMEMALIAKISVFINVTMIKYGVKQSKGHSISLPHEMDIATNLPRLPNEVKLVIIKRSTSELQSKHYLVSRNAVELALKGLCYGYPFFGKSTPDKINCRNYNHKYARDHRQFNLKGRYFQFFPNPFYHDVCIQEKNLSLLPVESGIPKGLKIINSEKIFNTDFSLNDTEENQELSTKSGVVNPLHVADTDEQLKLVLSKILGSDDKANELISNNTIHQANMDRLTSDPVNELKTIGFFSMAFPTVWPDGFGDFTVERLISVPLDKWIEHIYYHQDNRVASHPFLKFFLLNIKLKKQSLEQGRFLVSQQLNDAHLTLKELKEKFENNDDSVARKIISFAKNIINTDPYWRYKKKEVDAMLVYKKYESSTMASFFDTSSCAEFHWKPLHNLLIKYWAKISGRSIDEVSHTFLNDKQFRFDVLMKNSHIVSHYFDCRKLNYMRTVGQFLFNIVDFWFRYEFALGRGAIHSHDILFSDYYSKIFKEVVDKLDEDESANILERCLQLDEKCPEFQSMHPGGGFVNTELDEQSWTPNLDYWPKPEGLAPQNAINPLETDVSQVVNDANGVKKLHIDMVNKVALHKCCSYCLKKKTVKVDGVDTVVKVCRFHFGEYDIEKKVSQGKVLHPFHPIILGNDHKRYEGKRDHPRLIQHSKPKLLAWKANIDTQPLIEKSIVSLQNYLTPYTCKGAKSTDDLISIYKSLLDMSNESSTIKSIAQKLLLRIVGFIDVPETAVDFILTLVRCSRKFNPVGISGYRMLDQSQKGENITKKNAMDKYLSDKNRDGLSMYDYFKKCNCPKKAPVVKNTCLYLLEQLTNQLIHLLRNMPNVHF